MRRATAVCPGGAWPEGETVGTVTLEYDERHRRRIRLHDDAGVPFLLDLAEAARLVDGDGLTLSGGGYIRVRAAAEPVADVRCRSLTETARVAWHIGNRHVPLQVLDDGTLRVRDDHVIVDLARHLGATVERKTAPFNPEPGAYARAGTQGHGHGHRHDH